LNGTLFSKHLVK